MSGAFVKASPDRARVEKVLAGLTRLSERSITYSYGLTELGRDRKGRQLYGISRGIHAVEDPAAEPIMEPIFFTEEAP